MKNISFFLTTKQVRECSKTVTRRTGWAAVKPGEQLQACVKCQGIKPGELERICVIEVVSARREPLSAMTDADCALEGFPEMNAQQFIAMFCEHMKVTPDEIVTRIEFKYV